MFRLKLHMFLEFYGFREQPFGVTPDPRFFFDTPVYQEAWASLTYGVAMRRGFMALIAEPGMGKTSLIFRLLADLSDHTRTALFFRTQCTSQDFLRGVLTEFGCDVSDRDTAYMHEQLNQILVKDARAGTPPLVIVDEAQNLDDTVLESVRLLSNFETPRAKLVQIILSGQAELAERLSAPPLAQLRQRISILCRLAPLVAAEVPQYIEHRLRVAGYTGAPLFTTDAYSFIASVSGGVPRNINNICFNALSLAYALQRQQVDVDVLSEVSADLDVNQFYHSAAECAPHQSADTCGRRAVLLKEGRASAEGSSVEASAQSSPPLANSSQIDAAAQFARRNGKTHTQPLPRWGRLQFKSSQHFPTTALGWIAALVLITAIAAAWQDEIAGWMGTANMAHNRSGSLSAQPDLNGRQRSLAQQKQPVVRHEAVSATGASVTTTQAGSQIARRRRFAAAETPVTSPTSGEGRDRANARVETAPGSALVFDAERDYKADPPPITTVSGGDTALVQTPQLSFTARTAALAPIVGPATQPAPTLRVVSPAQEVVEGRQIKMVRPTFPPAAKQAHVDGKVVLAVLASSDGRVRDIRILSGHELLIAAAVAAVREWRYEPSYLAGKPIEFERKVIINFKLDSDDGTQ